MAKSAKKKEETVSLETVLQNCRVALRGVGSTDKNRDQQHRQDAEESSVHW